MKIVTTAPSRISLFGGGTDLEPYVSEYGGKVIGMAINLRQKITLGFDESFENSFPYNADPSFFNFILKEYKINGIHRGTFQSQFDGFVKSGLGSSASMAVALIAGIHKYQGLPLDRGEIAHKAWTLENKFGHFTGKQDAYFSSYGGCNLIEFGKQVRVNPIGKDASERFASWITIFYIGDPRDSHTIQSQIQFSDATKKVLDDMKYKIIAARVWIENGFIQGVGELLDESWDLKKKLSPVISNDKIDHLYDFAKENGAIGGKVIGAGGGGYMLFISPPDKQKKLIEAMKTKALEQVDFSIDWNGVEARIV